MVEVMVFLELELSDGLFTPPMRTNKYKSFALSSLFLSSTVTVQRFGVAELAIYAAGISNLNI